MKPEQYAKSGSEFSHQVALFMQCAYNLKKYPELKWFHSIQNEEKSGSKILGGKAKASGKKAGVSDLFLPVKKTSNEVVYSGLYIELKKLKASGVGPSKEQLEFGEFVTKQGFAFCVCYGWEEAWNALESYLNLS